MLEPYEGKLSRTVLREEGGSNTTNLLDTNLKYLYHMVLKKEGYNKKTLTFEELNEEAENFSNSE
ncbi:hypothetical protein JXW99_10070 [Streptococcus suis]|nr:hypothetical protein [Streptococcus suis]MCB2902498.1 hypothetical protein [Streptococcus suis]